MKTLIVLTALVALATAFDFPEEWELWKKVRGKRFIIIRTLLRTFFSVKRGNLCDKMFVWLLASA